MWRIRAHGYPDSNPGSTIGVSSYSYSAHAYLNSESYEYSNTIHYGCTRTYRDSHGYSNSYSSSYTYPATASDQHTHAYGNTYTSSYGYANTNTYPDQHTHAYSNTYTSSYSYANTDPYRTHLNFRQRDKDRARRARSWPLDSGNFHDRQRGLQFRKL